MNIWTILLIVLTILNFLGIYATYNNVQKLAQLLGMQSLMSIAKQLDIDINVADSPAALAKQIEDEMKNRGGM